MRYILVLIALSFSLTTVAEVVDCASLTATQRRQAETIGACSPSAQKSVCLPATDQGLLALIDLLSEEANYQETVPCRLERVVDTIGILLVAGVGDGACVSSLVDTQVPNPQIRRQVALKWWRAQLNDRILASEAEKAAQVERERVENEETTAISDP